MSVAAFRLARKYARLNDEPLLDEKIVVRACTSCRDHMPCTCERCVGFRWIDDLAYVTLVGESVEHGVDRSSPQLAPRDGDEFRAVQPFGVVDEKTQSKQIFRRHALAPHAVLTFL